MGFLEVLRWDKSRVESAEHVVVGSVEVQRIRSYRRSRRVEGLQEVLLIERV